ncbi:MAG: TetR/AcrR family transcriptional regulator [Acidimicrobiales bacterium]
MRAPARPAHQARRRELAAIAYAQIAERGLEGLRVREVASGAGINHATLIYYFPTKADLVAAVVDHVLGLLLVPAVAPAPGPGEAVMRRLGHELDDIAARLDHQPEIFRVLTELQLRGQRDAEVAGALARMDAAWHGYLAAMVRSGIESGELRAALDADEVARALTVLFRGLGLEALRPGRAAGVVQDALDMLRRWLRAG